MSRPLASLSVSAAALRTSSWLSVSEEAAISLPCASRYLNTIWKRVPATTSASALTVHSSAARVAVLSLASMSTPWRRSWPAIRKPGGRAAAGSASESWILARLPAGAKTRSARTLALSALPVSQFWAASPPVSRTLSRPSGSICCSVAAAKLSLGVAWLPSQRSTLLSLASALACRRGQDRFTLFGQRQRTVERAQQDIAAYAGGQLFLHALDLAHTG